MKDKKRKKTNFWKNLSIFILIFLLIKVGIKFIKENVSKYKISERDDLEKEV